MSQDEERAVTALIGAGPTLNVWREPIHAVQCALNIPMADARALVEVLQHRGLVRVKREKTSGFPRLHWWVRGIVDPTREIGRRMIASVYPTLADGKIRELKANCDLLQDASIRIPDSFSGRLCDIPSVPDFLEMRDSVVIFEGRQYKFVNLSRDGSFVMRKRW